MTSTSGNNLYESQSITKPPYFNEDNYPYWKNRMKLITKSQDCILWDVVEDVPTIPLKREGDQLVPKSKNEMTDEDRRRLHGNDKAMHIIFCDQMNTPICLLSQVQMRYRTSLRPPMKEQMKSRRPMLYSST
ncbi:hypothetical protein GQ457_02G020450 [Hibiscus cannabinus]